jgi:hypothetical protein
MPEAQEESNFVALSWQVTFNQSGAIQRLKALHVR